MRRCVAVAVVASLMVLILVSAAGGVIPHDHPVPAAADAWILQATPVPPVGPAP